MDGSQIYLISLSTLFSSSHSPPSAWVEQARISSWRQHLHHQAELPGQQEGRAAMAGRCDRMRSSSWLALGNLCQHQMSPYSPGIRVARKLWGTGGGILRQRRPPSLPRRRLAHGSSQIQVPVQLLLHAGSCNINNPHSLFSLGPKLWTQLHGPVRPNHSSVDLSKTISSFTPSQMCRQLLLFFLSQQRCQLGR